MKYILLACNLFLSIIMYGQFDKTKLSKIGEEIQQSTNQGKSSALDKYLDLDSMVNYSLFLAGQGDGFMSDEFTGGFKGEFQIAEELKVNSQNGGSFDFLRVVERSDYTALLFRFVDPEMAINYYEFIPYEDGGEYKLYDIYTYLSGERMSKTIADNITNMLSSDEGKDHFLGLQKLQQMSAWADRGEYDRAKSIWKKLPESVKRTKTANIYHLTMLMNIEGEEESYEKALKEYKKSFPNDPSLPLMMIDYYFLKGDMNKCMASVNELDSHVKDPFLNAYRVAMMEELDEMLTAYETAFSSVSRCWLLDVTLGTLYYYTEDKSKLFAHLDGMVERNGLTKKEVRSIMLESVEEQQSNLLNEWMRN